MAANPVVIGEATVEDVFDGVCIAPAAGVEPVNEKPVARSGGWKPSNVAQPFAPNTHGKTKKVVAADKVKVGSVAPKTKRGAK
jgi:hypothetical protein